MNAFEPPSVQRCSDIVQDVNDTSPLATAHVEDTMRTVMTDRSDQGSHDVINVDVVTDRVSIAPYLDGLSRHDSVHHSWDQALTTFWALVGTERISDF